MNGKPNSTIKGDTIMDAHTGRRNTDPATSHKAAREITESGARQTQSEVLLVAVRTRQGGTVGQYATVTELDSQQISRRMADLHNRGDVYPKGEHKFNGHSQQRWWIGEDPNGINVRSHCKTCVCHVEGSQSEMQF